jgi:hypothetical protein
VSFCTGGGGTVRTCCCAAGHTLGHTHSLYKVAVAIAYTAELLQLVFNNADLSNMERYLITILLVGNHVLCLNLLLSLHPLCMLPA